MDQRHATRENMNQVFRTHFNIFDTNFIVKFVLETPGTLGQNSIGPAPSPTVDSDSGHDYHETENDEYDGERHTSTGNAAHEIIEMRKMMQQLIKQTRGVNGNIMDHEDEEDDEKQANINDLMTMMQEMQNEMIQMKAMLQNQSNDSKNNAIYFVCRSMINDHAIQRSHQITTTTSKRATSTAKLSKKTHNTGPYIT
eukprot:463156_1